MVDSLSQQLQRALGDAYELGRELTGGGMSRVFVAVERALDREVVVKVLPPELAAGVNRERFRREIQLAAQLQHPHIVPLLAAGESGDLLYYTMPFIRGRSLKAAIDERGALGVAEVIRILHDVVDALAYAHEHGVVHRDIKPANVLMSGTHALITDFGVAKALSAALPISGVTTAGIAIGTPAYMAPEQLAGDPAADHRVDIYAVGLLAYELLSGSSPFASESPQATMAAQLTRTPEPLDQVRTDVPPHVARAITRCLEKSPADRPQTARALLTELDPATAPAAVARVGRRGRPSRRVVAATTAVVTLAVVSALALRFGDGGPRTDAEGVSPGGIPATPPASPLTRADSVAIAQAVHARVAETERSVPQGTFPADSLRAVIARAVVDSVRVAQAQMYQALIDSVRRSLEPAARTGAAQPAPASGATVWTGTAAAGAATRIDARTLAELQRVAPGVKVDEHGRVLVESVPMAAGVAMPPNPAIPGTVFNQFHAFGVDSAAARRVAMPQEFHALGGDGAAAALVRPASDSLKSALVARVGGRLELMPADPQWRALGSDALGLSRHANAGIAVIGYVRVRGDSVIYQAFVADRRQGWGYRVFASRPAPIADPMRNVPALTEAVVAWLDRPARPQRPAPREPVPPSRVAPQP